MTDDPPIHRPETPGGIVAADSTLGYIETFVRTVESADWSDPEGAHAEVVARMKRHLLSNELAFLMDLGIEPLATQMGLLVQPVSTR